MTDYTRFELEQDLLDALTEEFERREDWDSGIENEFQNLYGWDEI